MISDFQLYVRTRPSALGMSKMIKMKMKMVKKVGDDDDDYLVVRVIRS